MLRPMFAILALTAGVSLTACEVLTETITHDASGVAAPLTRIITNVDVGDVIVIAAATTVTTVHVEAEAQWSKNRPEVTFRQEGETFYTEVSCEDRDPNCRVDITITVPRGVAVEVNGGETSITASSLRAAATLLTGDGDIDVKEMSGALTLKTRDGEIRGSLLSSKFMDAGALDGKVDLTFADGAEDVTIGTRDGDVLLTVPRDNYRVEAATDGKLMVGVMTLATAGKHLVVQSHAGNITIQPR